ILADDDAMAMLAALKHQSRRLPDLERQLRRDQTVGTAPNPIRTEIFAAHVTPRIAQGPSSHPATSPERPPSSRAVVIIPLGAKMTSKNIMNRYRRPIRRLTLNLLLTHRLCRPRAAAGLQLVLALDVKVAFRGRRLGDIDRVRPRKGLLQPLLQGLIQPALLCAFSVFGVGAWSGHGCRPGWQPSPVKRFCGGPKRARCTVQAIDP